ncbi:hypothetical protein [Streptomyces sp. NPDC006463]|uniref:hypothetical protein n=1 Tax=Streptomyces sp. NPDC006463 TaxID=3364746 RepID=UPI0036AE72A3
MHKLDTTRDTPRTPVITPPAGHATGSPNTTASRLAAPGRGSTELSTRTVTRDEVATRPERSTRRDHMWTAMSGTRETVLGPPSQLLGLIAFPHVR